MNAAWLSGFPGLGWRIDVARSKFTSFNNWEFSPLGKDTSRLLKDAGFRRRVIRREDFPLVAEFWDMLLARQAAAVTFRIDAVPDCPLIMQGWPDSPGGSGYFGFLKPAILPQVFSVDGITATCQMALGIVEYPVFILNVKTKEIIVSNKAANELFGTNGSEQVLQFGHIVSGEFENVFLSSARQAIDNDVWSGTLILHNNIRNFFTSKVRISSCCLNHEGSVVRIAILNAEKRNFDESSRKERIIRKHNGGLKKELNKILRRFSSGIDGLMLSVIRSHQGEVDVYGVGDCFNGLPWGSTHAYEGTIAQDIERFGLSSLVVEDTLDSIKSIDWVLFIPHGVRSYFARPCYENGELYAVLIIASRSQGYFPPDAGERFVNLMDNFEKIAREYQ